MNPSIFLDVQVHVDDENLIFTQDGVRYAKGEHGIFKRKINGVHRH